MEAFLILHNGDDQFFQQHEIEAMFQRYSEGRSDLLMCEFAAVEMVHAIVLQRTNEAPSRAVEDSFQRTLRQLPAIIADSPDNITLGTMLLMVGLGQKPSLFLQNNNT